ncbi:MAG TPA: exodeoxyribonuclease VII large subunit [Planctomycetaceae bacterium]|nr:exodeoxyribonuclease VII large subunit [Planctomycetaceae bacterium]
MPPPEIKTVSQITRELKNLVETHFPTVWVEGEVSNCTRAASGHVYFTLKDEFAQLRAVIWRSTAARFPFELQDGLHVIAAGPIEVYQPRGTYQLIVQQLLPRGLGALELAFRQLQEKLAAEGLFDAERKRPLPRFPRRIALVTSPTGAAVRDIVQVIMRRWQAVDIVVVPVPVQGEGAAEQIAAALRRIPRLPQVDLVITGRGGGSLEDLWPFNEEVVARAIFECPIPVISAVGHEIDVSIADLVADRRALTPSEAGELAVPLRSEVEADLRRLRDRLVHGLRQRAERARLTLDAIASRRIFTHPRQRIHDLTTRLDELSEAMRRAVERRAAAARQSWAALAHSLQALSPLRVLQRGYTVTSRSANGESSGGLGPVIREVSQVAVGDAIITHLARGRIASRVEAIDPNATIRPPDPYLPNLLSQGDSDGEVRER